MRIQILLSAIITFSLMCDIFPDRTISLGFKIIAVGLLLGALIITAGSGERGFIFGPNILYRAVIFPFFNSGFILAILIAVGISMATLSRGAFLTGAILAFWQFPLKWRFLIVCSSLIIATLLLQQSLGELPRFARFYDIDGSNSISDRFKIWASTFDQLSPIGQSYDSFNQNFPFIKYPHNSIIELIYFYGFPGIITSVYLLYTLTLALLGKRSLIAIPCIIPTLLSGNIVDNFLLLTMAIAYASKK